MNNFKLELLTSTFEAIASYKGDNNALDKVADFILKSGVDVVFEDGSTNFGTVLSKLQPVQIMTLSKRVFKEMVRATYYEAANVQRDLQNAVEYKGVDGNENPLEVVAIDGQTIDPYEKHNAFRSVLDDMYPALSAAFTAAGRIVLNGREEPLPWYTTQADDGKGYNDCFSYEEAERMIDRARERAAEERQQRNKQSLEALAGLSF